MINNKDRYKECKGCNYEHFETLYQPKKTPRFCVVKHPVISPTEQCPCITCIVKMVCKRTCSEFWDFRGLLLQKGLK